MNITQDEKKIIVWALTNLNEAFESYDYNYGLAQYSTEQEKKLAKDLLERLK